jgi:hypothetical protein
MSRILTLAALDSRLELNIGEPIEVSNYNTILQILMMSAYAIKLYTLSLGHNYFSHTHTSHSLLLKLVRYLKLLLGLPLVIGLYLIMFIDYYNILLSLLTL